MRRVQNQPRPPAPGAQLLKRLKQQITADSRRGTLSLREMCEKYDCSPSAIRILLKDRGVAAAGRIREKISYREPPARFFADARKGLLTRHDLARKYRMSYQATTVHINEAGIPLPRKPAALPAPVNAERARRKIAIKALYKQGKTLEEIGARHDLSRERVRQILARIAQDAGELRPCKHPGTKEFGHWNTGWKTGVKTWTCRVCNLERRRAAKGA